MLNKLTNKKGFTLIEMVIVIVIIAIIAAILVPSLLGYVDKAKDSDILSAAKTVLDCISSQMADDYKDQTPPENDEGFDAEFWKKVSANANTTIDADDVDFEISNGNIKNFIYYSGEKKAYINDKGAWVVTDAATD